MAFRVATAADDWEIIGADWWRTSFCDVPWSYISRSATKTQQKSFHGPMFCNLPPRPSPGDENDSVNVELVGVKTALDAVVAYERDVGFYTALPDLHLEERKAVDWSREVDDAKVVAVRKKTWDGLLDDLMNGPVPDDDNSSLSSSSELHRSVSVFSSLSSVSIDSIGVPSTPKAKSVFADVEIKDASPSGSTYYPLSPTRSLNAAASSFVPTFCPHLNDEPMDLEEKQNPTAESFSNFTFPTLNANAPMSRTRKDDQSFFSDGTNPDGLLPPFMQDSPIRNRNRKSRTREIVDRLRSRMAPPNEITSLSLSPTPIAAETKLLAPRLSVSEDGGDRVSRLSSPCEDEDGWVDISQPNAPSPSHKNKRARELLFALTRRRTDSLPSENTKDIVLESLPQDASSSPPPPPPPPLLSSTDGWVEHSPKPPTEPQKKSKPAPNHGRKKSANHVSRTSTSHPHSHTHSHSHSQAHPQFSSPGYPTHASGSGALPHLLPPQMLQAPYFFPAYPSVGVPMPAYPPFMQMPAYHLAMSMQATHIAPAPAGIQYAMGPTLGLPPQPAGAAMQSMKHGGGGGNVPPFRSKHAPVW